MEGKILIILSNFFFISHHHHFHLLLCMVLTKAGCIYAWFAHPENSRVPEHLSFLKQSSVLGHVALYSANSAILALTLPPSLLVVCFCSGFPRMCEWMCMSRPEVWRCGHSELLKLSERKWSISRYWWEELAQPCWFFKNPSPAEKI